MPNAARTAPPPAPTYVTAQPTITLPGGITLTATGVSVTRTFRRSLKLGEDFRTLDQTTEITVEVPSDVDPIAAAIALGEAIDAAHTTAFEPIVARWRDEGRMLEESGPPSAKASRYLGSLMRDLTATQQAAVYHVANVNPNLPLTAGTCSALIDTIRGRWDAVLARVAQVESETAQATQNTTDADDIPF